MYQKGKTMGFRKVSGKKYNSIYEYYKDSNINYCMITLSFTLNNYIKEQIQKKRKKSIKTNQQDIKNMLSS